MTTQLSIDTKSSALLVMDFQTLIVNGYATDQEALLARTKSLLDAARGKGMKVIYVVVGFRPGYPEVSDRNMIFRSIKEAGRLAADDPTSGIHSAVAPIAGESVVTKHRVGAFAGTDLEMILRANNIETLLLAGIATSGVVLSTVRHAADADYRLVVVKDCCSDPDAEVQRVLVEKVFARQAVVATAEQIIAALT
jgi:nicotinamidase-related amidase